MICYKVVWDIMSLEQIFDEKLEMQTFLLEFEKVHGHPETKEEKDAMKDLYERYRSVKRLARRSSSVSKSLVRKFVANITKYILGKIKRKCNRFGCHTRG